MAGSDHAPAPPRPDLAAGTEPPRGVVRQSAEGGLRTGRMRFRGFGGGDADIVPSGWMSGPMPWVLAIMVALTVIASAAGLALSHMMTAASADLAGGLTVQVLEPDAGQRARQVAAVITVLRAEPGMAEVRQVPQAELDAMIAPWLGSDPAGDAAGQSGLGQGGLAQGGLGQGLPVPALVDARLAGGVDAGRLAALRARLRQVAPGAEVDSQADWLGPVFDAMRSLKVLAAAMIVLLASAMAAAVLLATRTALGNHRATIEIVHNLGATDRQIARVFQRSIGADALVGALAGFAAALVVIWFLGRRFAALGAGLINGGALGWADWLVLAGLPLAAVLLAVLTARLSVLRALARML